MQPILVAFVYGNPNITRRKFLLEALKEIISSNGTPWMVVEEFKAILSKDEKKRCWLHKEEMPFISRIH